MAHRVTSRVRIIVAELDESAKRGRPRRDYRALLQRGKSYRAASMQAESETDEGAGEEASLYDDADDEPEAPLPVPGWAGARSSAPGWQTATPARPKAGTAQSAPVSTAPYIEALTNHHERSVRAIEWLAARVGDFCSDPAVIGSGIWTTRLQLDPAVLPFCTLELMLSHSQVTLRFDANDPSSKQLILDNRQLLQARLTTIFVRQGLHRTIEIMV